MKTEEQTSSLDTIPIDFNRALPDNDKTPSVQSETLSVKSDLHISLLTPASSATVHPATKDENIVNTALVVFLQSFSYYLEKRLHVYWTSERKSYTLGVGTNKCFEARCDGALVGERSHEMRVILEAKPMVRQLGTKKALDICMQESAQMAAWIAHETGKSSGLHVDMDLKYR